MYVLGQGSGPQVVCVASLSTKPTTGLLTGNGCEMPSDSEFDLEERAPRSLPPELLTLSYQNRLRSIGRALDVDGYRSILILQVAGGFIVRAVRRSDRDIEVLEFTDDSYVERMIQATESRGEGERTQSPSPLAPTGFEDLLRAVGRLLDTGKLAEVVIAEKLHSIVLAGEDVSGDKPAPFDIELNEARITQLLDESFRLRSRRE